MYLCLGVSMFVCKRCYGSVCVCVCDVCVQRYLRFVYATSHGFSRCRPNKGGVNPEAPSEDVLDKEDESFEPYMTPQDLFLRYTLILELVFSSSYRIFPLEGQGL